jgi:ribosome-associated protein
MGEALSSEDKVAHMNRIVMDRKAMDVVVLDMRDSSSITDYFLICSGGSERQIRAIVDAIDEGMNPLGLASLGVEGYRDGHWILMDYGDVIVHVFSPETREYYDLERLWANAPRLDLSGEITGVVSQHGASIG